MAKKWEYKVEEFSYREDAEKHEETLNRCGEEGWELVAVIDTSVAGIWAYFKREKA